MPEHDPLLQLPKKSERNSARNVSIDDPDFFGKHEPSKSTLYLFLLTLCSGG